MKKNISLLGSLALLVVFLFAACNGGQDTQAYKEKADNPEYYHRSVKKLTDVIVHDIFSPPVASRIYAYSSVAGYEALRNEFPEFKSFAGQLNGLDAVPQPEAGKDYCFPLAAVHAFLSTGRKMIFSEDQIEEFQNQIYKEFKDLGMSEEVYNNSLAYGTAVHDHIMKWSSGDM